MTKSLDDTLRANAHAMDDGAIQSLPAVTLRSGARRIASAARLRTA
jgi:hypothetical protein